MANIATQGGRARDDEYLVRQRGTEEGWLSVSESEGSGSVTESSVTPGREVTGNGVPDEQSVDG